MDDTLACYLCTLGPRAGWRPVTHEVDTTGDLLRTVYTCDVHLQTIRDATANTGAVRRVKK